MRRGPMGRNSAAALVFSCVLLVTAQPATAEEIPQIYLYVNDLASPPVLLTDERNALENLCYEVDFESSAEIAVLIVNTTLPLGIDMFAVRVFEENHVGKEGLDNGVLILVSVDERQWRIEVGYGLEGILPDAFLGAVGRDILEPSLVSGDYYAGVYDAAYEVGLKIVTEYDPGSGPRSEPQPVQLDWWPIVLPFLIFVGLAFLSKGRLLLWLGTSIRFKRGGFGGGRSGGGGAKGGY